MTEKTIQDQLVLETTKIDTLEIQAHQWISHANPSVDSLDKIRLHMKRILDTIEETAQRLGHGMSNIVDLSIQQNMSNLSSLTTLTIDIQKVLRTWKYFQHHLAVKTEASVEVCIHKRPSIRKQSP